MCLITQRCRAIPTNYTLLRIFFFLYVNDGGYRALTLILDHLYIHPTEQGAGLGGVVLERIKALAVSMGLPIKLGALKESPANQFYRKHGFVKTHEEDWDNYYVWKEFS